MGFFFHLCVWFFKSCWFEIKTRSFMMQSKTYCLKCYYLKCIADTYCCYWTVWLAIKRPLDDRDYGWSILESVSEVVRVELRLYGVRLEFELCLYILTLYRNMSSTVHMPTKNTLYLSNKGNYRYPLKPCWVFVMDMTFVLFWKSEPVHLYFGTLGPFSVKMTQKWPVF